MAAMNSTCSCLLNSMLLLLFIGVATSQKSCPNCGAMEVPYPLSTGPNCGDPDYKLFCDPSKQQLFFESLNRSSYRVLRIDRTMQRMVVQASPWVPGTCVTRDMVASEGVWLNQSLPFNITTTNTIFLFNCSPRLLISPLNCTPSSLCHRYLASSGRVDPRRALQCSDEAVNVPCCTFVAGGSPSAYKIRLHNGGCRGYRSILNLDPSEPASEWEEGMEIQWASPPEPVCGSQQDCSAASTCSPRYSNNTGTLIKRCICSAGYDWDHALGACAEKKAGSASSSSSAGHRSQIIMLTLFLVIAALGVIAAWVLLSLRRGFCKVRNQARVAKERDDILSASKAGRSAKIFEWKEVKKATGGFSPDRLLGTGGFGKVYKGVLKDGTLVAVKSAKLGNTKGTEHVLNEVGILSQVNHKNLVRLLGCCVQAEQPLMVYEYVPNGTLYDHLQSKDAESFLRWSSRLSIALQTAEALAYLHSSAHTPIYHRDVKSTNILLDEKLNAKVADFGLSRLAEPGLSHVSTCVQGTLGYLDPEYYRNYKLTDKSDVYSFGVVLLELLTSQKAIDFTREQEEVNLALWVAEKAEKGAIMEVVDHRLLGEGATQGLAQSIKMFAALALACVQEKNTKRPNMREAAQELLSVIQIPNGDSPSDASSPFSTSLAPRSSKGDVP
ncbi:hypothetical protein AMTRI_Chr03g147230 [Amborella trichopoda]